MNRIKIASEFLLDSPPGEFHEVLNDLRVLVNSDKQLQEGIISNVILHNTNNFITAKLAQNDVIVSKFGKINDTTFYDQRLKPGFTSFSKFDHIRQTASDQEPYSPEQNHENLRKAIDDAVVDYTLEHYPSGVSAVYSAHDSITILIVSNKYNPNNFWNGRWRSQWTFHVAKHELKGLVRSNVHYYEDGNIQLNTEKEIVEQITNSSDPASIAAGLLKVIKESEYKYQQALNESYTELSESTFKGLRRALPVTKTKVDWNKILNYKVASSLAR